MEVCTVPSHITEYVTLAEGIIASDFALANLNKSLGSAQVEFSPAVKSELNRYGGYNYTPLSAIVAAFRPALTKHHLTLMQPATADLENKTVTVYSRLAHWDSGEWIQVTLTLPAELSLGKDGAPKFNQQTIGGSQTYAQKYGCKGILVLPDAEELIDSTEDKGDLPARARTQAKPQGKTGPTEADFLMWKDAFEECGTIEEWNRLIVPMMKERADHPQYGRQFIIAAAEEAKRRGYVGDRTSGAYKEKKTPIPAVDEYEQGYAERGGK